MFDVISPVIVVPVISGSVVSFASMLTKGAQTLTLCTGKFKEEVEVA